MYRPKTRARFAANGALLALVADGEETPGPLDFLEVEEGAEPLTREQITEALAGLDRDQLQAVVDAAIAEGQAIAEDDSPITAEVLARINALADAREAAEERQTALDEADREAQEQRDAALARLAPPSADADEDSSDDASGEGSDAGEGEGGDAASDAAREQTPEPVAAAAPRTGSTASRGRRVSAVARPGAIPSSGTREAARTAPAAYTAPRATATLVAAAGNERAGLEAGAAITTAHDLGEAINNRRHALRRSSGGDGEQVIVASVRTDYPEERYLGDDAGANTRRIEAATSEDTLVAAGAAAREGGALVAAGGLCAPLNMDYEVPVLGSVARPVRDQALTRFGADRGGVKWRQSLSFGDFAGATGIWTLAMDEAQGDDGVADPTPKPCLDVVCPDDAEAYVEAITLCLEFSNMTSRFDPEATAANVQAAQVAHARLAENRLMAQIAALSTTLTAARVVSAIRDELLATDRLIAAYRNFYRLDEDVPLRAVKPRWFLDQVRADLMLGAGVGSGDDLNAALGATSAQVNAWFAARNVNITWHLDGRPATASGAGEVTMANQFYGAFVDNGAVPEFPAQIETLLWREGDMLHLDGGSLDLGVVRDSSLNQQNRYKQFSETFEGVAHRGVEAVRLVTTTVETGMTAGTADTAAILAA